MKKKTNYTSMDMVHEVYDDFNDTESTFNGLKITIKKKLLISKSLLVLILSLVALLIICFSALSFISHAKVDNMNEYENEKQEKSKILLISIDTFGWMYFVSWSISMYPQVILNYNRQSVEGLNFDFLMLNIIGHSSYLAYNAAFYWLKSVQNEYFKIHPGGVNPVLLNDVFFSLHATIITLFTIYQCFIYEKAGQKISKASCFFALFLVGYLVFTGVLTFFNQINVLEYAYCFSYVKLAVTLLKYMPQAYMNYQRKSTRGWSIENVLLDFLGGVLSIMQMFLLAFTFDDWSSILGSPTKFGLGLVTIIYDIIFIVQHYVLYPYS